MNFKKYMFNSKLLAVCFASMLIATSCGGDKPKEEDNNDVVVDTDTAKTAVLNVGGELFSVPSPIQTAMLIQKSGVSYDKSVLNVSNKANTYTDDFMRQQKIPG